MLCELDRRPPVHQGLPNWHWLCFWFLKKWSFLLGWSIWYSWHSSINKIVVMSNLSLNSCASNLLCCCIIHQCECGTVASLQSLSIPFVWCYWLMLSEIWLRLTMLVIVGEIIVLRSYVIAMSFAYAHMPNLDWLWSSWTSQILITKNTSNTLVFKTKGSSFF